jgi:hypothetical protein
MMLNLESVSPRGEYLQQKQAKPRMEKIWLVLTYLLMVFLLYEVANPGFEVRSLFSIG